MYINMTPDKTNKTLHASQDDTKRQFKFKLVNDSQVLDTSDSIPPVIYDVEPNGIEQLLPVNSSTPTTSPIIADIQYPDELRENQEFFERITPTTLKGQAKIEKIKGNTLVFNQLVQNGNFADTSVWTVATPISFTVQNNIATVITNTDGDYNIRQLIPMIIGHKYIYFVDCWTDDNTYTEAIIFYGGASDVAKCEVPTNNTWASFSGIFTCVSNQYNFIRLRNQKIGITNKFRNVSIIDLTLMFGSGNEPTTVSDFTNLFPLPYYDYNAGSLLSFNGTGIKSVGKNLLSYSGENLPYNANGVSITRENNIYKVVATNPSGYPFARISTIRYLPKGQYTVLMLGTENSNTGIAWRLIDRNVSPARTIVNSSLERAPFTINEDLFDVYFEITINASSLTAGTWDMRFALEIGVQTDYEPYTESTIDLPISTYFPTGMKSAGTVYDELTPTKATTRIGAVDLGSINWNYTSSGQGRFYSNGISSLAKPVSSNSNIANIKCPIYLTVSAGSVYAGITGIAIDTSGSIWVHDTSQGTDATAFKSAISGVYLYYELATPTEEDIESCSLVSEDIEKPLAYDNGFLVCDSDGLTSKAGFIPCKVKMVKGDEILYSQLINLHVERKP